MLTPLQPCCTDHKKKKEDNQALAIARSGAQKLNSQYARRPLKGKLSNLLSGKVGLITGAIGNVFIELVALKRKLLTTLKFCSSLTRCTRSALFLSQKGIASSSCRVTGI